MKNKADEFWNMLPKMVNIFLIILKICFGYYCKINLAMIYYLVVCNTRG